jgi:hypothetical protein
LKYVGALWSGLAYLSRYNLGWFCHKGGVGLQRLGKQPAAVDHARAAETEEVGDPRKKTRVDLQNLKSAGTPL